MKKLIVFLFFFLFPLESLAELSSPINKPTFCAGKQIMGRIEKVNLLEKNLILNAKLDTGATMSSLSAEDIKVFDHDNKKWVSFTLYINSFQKKIILTKPLIRYTYILKRTEENSGKSNFKEYSQRPVVRLLVCLGNQKKFILVNLIDRSQFRYPLLLGKKALKDFKVIVDADQNYTSSLKCQTRLKF